jgi:hypothetical protein
LGRYFSVGLVLAIGVGCLTGWAKAQADLPRKLPPLESAQLQAALTSIQLIQTEAHAKAAPHLERAEKIAKQFKIEISALGKTVKINFDTGEIVRAQP